MAKTVQGFVLIDTWGAALNNAGTSPSERTDNIVRTKIIWRDGKPYPYVSGQAWRYWWRNTLAEHFDWKLSPVSREKKIAYTEADPFTYPDDDIFGYMRAPKKKKGESNSTRTRLSVLKNSILMSVGPHRPVEDFGTFSRFEGDPVPYEHEFYSTVLKGMFSIDLDRVGVFLRTQRAGYQNLPSDYEIPTEFKDMVSEDNEYVKLKKDIRVGRVTDVLKAILHMDGGAMQARHLTKVTPSIIVLAALDSGNHLFAHFAHTEDDVARLNVASIRQILRDYQDQFLTKLYVGREEGFMDDIAGALDELSEEFKDQIVVTTVKQAIEGFCEEVPDIMD